MKLINYLPKILCSLLCSFLLIFVSSKITLATVAVSPVINELVPEPTGNIDWIELYNPYDSEIDLSGWKLNNTNNTAGGPILTIASGTKIAGKGYLVFYKGLGTNKFEFDLTWQRIDVTLFRPDASIASTLSYSDSPGTNKSWGLYPNGNGAVTKFDVPTKGYSNGEEETESDTDTTPPDFPGEYGWGKSIPSSGYAGDGSGINDFKACGNAVKNDGDYRGVWAEASDPSGILKYQRQVVKDGILLWQGDESINYTGTFTPGVSGGAGDGDYFVRVRAIDTLNNATISDDEWADTSSYSSWCKLTIDTSPPTNPTKITSTPNVDDYTNGTIQLLWLPVGGDGGSSDTGSGVYGYSFSLDDSDSTIPEEIASSVENSLPQGVFYIKSDGQYYFHIRTVDNAGNWSDTLHLGPLGVDKTNPIADLIFDGTGPSFTGFKVKFSESVVPSEAEDGANYYLDNWPGAGGSGDLIGDATISYDSDSNEATVNFISAGWYISPEQTWGVTGIHDLAGNLIDSDPTGKTSTLMEKPVIYITHHTGGSYEGTWQGKISGTASDPNNGSGVNRVEVKVGSGSWNQASGTNSWNFEYTIEEEGEVTVKARAVDNAGNISEEASETITVDLTKPHTILSVGNPNFTSEETLFVSKNTLFTLTANDVGNYPSGLYATYYKIDEENIIGYSTPFDLSDYNSGVHVIQFWSQDLAGNIEEHNEVSVNNEKPFLDMDNPTSIITNVEEGKVYSPLNWEGEIKGTADDGNGSGVLVVDLIIYKKSDSTYWNGEGWQTEYFEVPAEGTEAWNYIFTPDSGGEYIITSKAVDNLNQKESSFTVNFSWDEESPAIPGIVSPANGDVIKPQNILFDWEGVTDDNGPVYYYFRIDGQEDIYTGYTSEYESPELSEGNYSWQVKACDQTDNCSDWSELSEITVDGTAPMTTDSGTDNNWHTGNVIITLSCADNVSCANTYYTTDGNDPTTESQSGNTVTLSVDGIYTIKYFSIDTAGNAENIKTAGNTVKIDKTKPNNVTASDSGMWAIDKKLTFNWSAAIDNGSGISYYKFYLSTAQGNTSPIPIINGTNIGNITSYTLSDTQALLLTGGQTYYAKVRAVDNAGNYQTSGGNWSNGIILDLSIPSSTPLTPETGYYNESSWNGAITGTASDTVSGLNKVEVRIKVNTTGGETKYWDGDGFDGDSESWLVATGTSSWQYNITPIEGSYTIYSRAFDNAGNIESTGVLTGVIYDITIPQVSLTTNPNNPDGDNDWYITKPKITLTANDNYEIEKIEYQLNSQNGTWEIYTNPVEITDGTTKFYYRATDKAGNISSVGLKNIKVDTQNPESIDNLGAEASDSLVSLDWDKSPSDDVDHYKIYRSIDKNFIPDPETEIDEVNSGNANYDDNSVDNNTKYYYYVVAFDEAGNYSDAVGISATPSAMEAEAEVGEVVNLPIPEGTVLGTEEEAKTPAPVNIPNTPGIPSATSPEVLGEQTTNNSNNATSGYWWVFGLLGILGLFIFFLLKKGHKKENGT